MFRLCTVFGRGLGIILLVAGCSGNESGKTVSTLKLDQTGSNIAGQVIYDAHIKSHESDDKDWYSNIPVKNRTALFETLLSGIETGKLAAYSTTLGEPRNDAESKMSLEMVLAAIKDTIELDGEVKDVKYNLNMLSQLTFVESWSYDEATGFTKQVKGLAVCREVYNENKEFMGYKRLFWVWFSDTDIQLEL